MEGPGVGDHLIPHRVVRESVFCERGPHREGEHHHGNHCDSIPGCRTDARLRWPKDQPPRHGYLEEPSAQQEEKRKQLGDDRVIDRWRKRAEQRCGRERAKRQRHGQRECPGDRLRSAEEEASQPLAHQGLAEALRGNKQARQRGRARDAISAARAAEYGPSTREPASDVCQAAKARATIPSSALTPTRYLTNVVLEKPAVLSSRSVTQFSCLPGTEGRPITTAESSVSKKRRCCSCSGTCIDESDGDAPRGGP